MSTHPNDYSSSTTVSSVSSIPYKPRRTRTVAQLPLTSSPNQLNTSSNQHNISSASTTDSEVKTKFMLLKS